MTAGQKRKVQQLEQEKDLILEQIRQEFYPNIPEEVFSPFQNFLFFMDNHPLGC